MITADACFYFAYRKSIHAYIYVILLYLALL